MNEIERLENLLGTLHAIAVLSRARHEELFDDLANEAEQSADEVRAQIDVLKKAGERRH